jgi:ankyrin repeat protein
MYIHIHTYMYIHVYIYTCIHTYSYTQGGQSALWVAASNGHAAVVKELLAAKADANTQEKVCVECVCV